jgi:hypothetical protein
MTLAPLWLSAARRLNFKSVFTAPCEHCLNATGPGNGRTHGPKKIPEFTDAEFIP